MNWGKALTAFALLAASECVTAKPPEPVGETTVFEEFRDDPVGFAKQHLDTCLWQKQADIAKSVSKNRRTATRSGHKIGKTRLAAVLGVWWVCTRENGVCIVTAPTDRQVRRAFWKEVRALYRHMKREGLPLVFPEPPLDPATGCRWEDGRELFGFTATSADNVSGPSGSEMLVIVDEASGVSQAVWVALQGLRAGGGHVLAIGNPTQPSGWFFNAFTAGDWERFVISCQDTPNYIEDREVIPGLADRAFVQEIKDDYGEDSPEYDVRVKGNFPKQSPYGVIGLGLLEAAHNKWLDLLDEKLDLPDIEDSALKGYDREQAFQLITADFNGLDIGVDVARFGDDQTEIAARRGFRAYIAARQSGFDSIACSGLVINTVKRLHRKGEPLRIKVDTIGYGAGVFDLLVQAVEDGVLPRDTEVIPVNVAEVPNDQEKYPLLRDEVWFTVQKWYKEGGATPEDRKLDPELLAAEYKLDGQGRQKVQPKEEVKKKIGRSPDGADALGLSVIMPASYVGDVSVGRIGGGGRSGARSYM